MSDPIVGIDLGTSNSVVAHADGHGEVEVLVDDGGYKIHPSVVSFHPSGGVVVGAAAKQRKVIDPQHTIYSVKRLIGRGYHAPEVQTAKARVPYEIKEGPNQLPMVVTRGGEFAIPEISAIVLDHVRNVAAARLETEVSRAVVTVPASFNDAQRAATATAGEIAGLNVVRVLNEPTAAALAYGHARDLRDIIAVYDFGGGTFDVSILKLEGQVYEVLGTAGDSFLGGDDLDERIVDRMAAKFLGEHGVDLRSNDIAMMRLRAVAEQTKIELSRRSRAVVRIDELAYSPHGGPLHFQIEISRDEFVREISDLVERTFPVCREALQLAGVGIDRVGDVLLVGGTTKIPYVREQVGRFFQQAPRTEVAAEDAVAAGAALQGATLERTLAGPRSPSRPMSAESRPDSESSVTRPDTSYSVMRGGTKDTFDGAAPSTGGLEDRSPTPDAQPLARMTRPPSADPAARIDSTIPPPVPPPIPKRPPGPASSTLDIPALSSTQPTRPVTARPPNPRSWADDDKGRPPPLPSPTAAPGAPTLFAPPPPPPLAPSSTARGFAPPAIALGAPAVSLAAAGPALPPPPSLPRPPVVLEVTPRSLGIGTVAGFCEELIRRNSRVPAEIRKLFTTSRDRQDVVRIVVCQGESRRLDQNVVIGDLVLQGLPPRPRGETSIEVTFSLDASGILQVQARDAATVAEQRARLDLLGGMPQQDVAASRDRLQLLRR